MIINIKVRPNSDEQSVEKLNEANYIVKLKSKPEKGKANKELINLLRKHFKKQVRIVKGLTSKNKIVEII